VWCFQATTGCAIDFSLDPGSGASGQITVANFGLGGNCSNVVTNCTLPLSDQSDVGGLGETVTVSNFSCPAGERICVYGATSGSAGTGTFTTAGADQCGDLPVEVQSFTIDNEETEPEAENDDER
jgi:hypothetical protein